MDLTKGGLVILMVLYHCASVNEARDTDGVRMRIHFLHYAFLIVSGYLCGWHYERSRAEPRFVRSRLRLRALKLFGLFLFANCLAALFALGGHSFLDLFANGSMVLHHVLLEMDGDFSAYEILWYIGLFLLIASVFVRTRLLVPAMLLLIVLAAFAPAPVCRFMAHGALGVLLGKIAADGMLRWFGAMAAKPWWLAVVLAAAYFMVVAPNFRLTQPVTQLAVNTLETVLWSTAVVLTFTSVSWFRGAAREIALLGEYTLFAYLLQMPLARLAHFGLKHLGLGGYGCYCVSLLLVGAATLLGVRLALRLRQKSPWLDRLYVCVFV